MKLRNRKSYLNSLPEGQAPSNFLSKLIHWIYFLVLLVIAIYFARYVYYRLSSVEGFGQVVVEKLVLSAGYAGKISDLPVVEGQVIRKGEKLVHIDNLKVCLQKENANIFKLKLDTEMKKAKLNILRAKLKQINSNQIMHRALELNNRKLSSATDLKFDIQLLAGELDVQVKLLQTLNHSIQTEALTPANCQDEHIYAPFNATVRRVLKENYEFVDKGEAIIIIENQQPNVQIEGYLSKYDLESVSLGNKITIYFPDEKQGNGIITKIDAAAYAFPDRKWENYEPIDTRIRILISPADEQQAKLWRQYNLMRVQIRGSLW